MPHSECGCSHCLLELDLTTCTSLTSVGDAVCRKRRLLSTVRLPPSVNEIGGEFCAGSYHLKVLDLSHCTELTRIGPDFAANCPELEEVRLPDKLLCIGSGFCTQCPSLKRVTMPSRLTTIGRNFCVGSASVDVLDLTACASLTEIGDHFAARCPKLEEVRLPRSTVESIEDEFCAECPVLRTVSFVAVKSASDAPEKTAALKVGSDFCVRCNSLVSLEMPKHTTRIGHRFCAKSEKITTIDLSGTSLVFIGDRFLSDCSALVQVQLPATLKKVGSGFVQFCAKLHALELWHTELREVGPGFARGCTGLEDVDPLDILPLDTVVAQAPEALGSMIEKSEAPTAGGGSTSSTSNNNDEPTWGPTLEFTTSSTTRQWGPGGTVEYAVRRRNAMHLWYWSPHYNGESVDQAFMSHPVPVLGGQKPESRPWE